MVLSCILASAAVGDLTQACCMTNIAQVLVVSYYQPAERVIGFKHSLAQIYSTAGASKSLRAKSHFLS